MENTAHTRDQMLDRNWLLGYDNTNNTTCSMSGGNHQSLVSDAFVSWGKGSEWLSRAIKS